MARSKPVTLADIAEQAGVSKMTVSLVLTDSDDGRIAEATRARVLQVARELDYHPNLAARHLARQETNVVGVIADSLETHFPALRIEAAIQALMAHDYQPLLCGLEWPMCGWDATCDMLLSNRVAAVVLVGPLGSLRADQSGLEPLIAAGVPLVSLDAIPEFPGAGADRRQAFYDLTSHLLKLGHRQFGYVGAKRPQSRPFVARLAGIQQALHECGEETALRYLSREDIPKARAGVDFGAHSAREFLSWRQRPSAVICYNDMAAMSFINRLHEAGVSVPEEVAVVGFDGVYEAKYCYPPLTTVTQPLEEAAERALQILVGMIREPEGDTPAYENIPGQLIIRESCGAGVRARQFSENVLLGY